MTATQSARRLANNDVLAWLTRAGFVGYAVIHLLLGWIAIGVLRGSSGAESDQSGAFRILVDQPLGKALLIAVGVGLVAMAIWQLLAAAVGHRDLSGKRRTVERVTSAARAVIYAGLAFTAFKVVAGAAGSVASSQQDMTTKLMSSPGGRWLVALLGIGVIVVSLILIWYGLTKRFERNLKTGQMSPSTRRWSRRLGMLGYAAKGVAYGIVGVLLVSAAVTYDLSKARGLDSALRTLAHQPYGSFLLLVVALGFFAYGVYCFIQARYRKV